MKASALVFALLTGVAGIGLNLLYMNRYEQEVSGGKPVEILEAARPILRGREITEDMLGVRLVPQAYVDERFIKAKDKARVLQGLRATSSVPVGQTLLWTDIIAPSDDSRDLSSLVQPGNRAMPLVVHQKDIVHLIKPGDFVDVISVNGPDSTVLLQRVLVLARGLDTSADKTGSQGADRGTMLTVSVSVAQSQLLALAMEKGRLTVVVRNPEDQRVADNPPDVNDSALADSSKRRTIQQARPHATGPSGPIRLEAESGGR